MENIMKYTIVGLSLFLLGLFNIGTVSSHHSVFAEYDINGSITIKGVVTEVWFKSPHVRFFVEVMDSEGSKVIWNTHGHNPAMLRRAGWTRDTLRAGEKVVMSGDPTYDGSPKMFVRTITLSDGTVLHNKVPGVN
tara:strand:- start:127 stop:531 length:405 start_codon:yes stop_codon:yes gene_type:complete